MIADALDNPITFETQYEEYRGKYRPLKIVEVPIELLVYRIENIRTKSLQKQWLVTHPECEKKSLVLIRNQLKFKKHNIKSFNH